MNKYIITILLFFSTFNLYAQNTKKTFKGHFYNEEHDIYLIIDLYDMNVEVPNHSLFDNLPGYLAKHHNSFYWLVTSGKIKDNNHAELDMINDFGSEDAKVCLEQINDSTFIFKQKEGSVIKIANNGKWKKLPKELRLKKSNH